MEEFWSLLDEKRAEVPPKNVIIVAGDLNGHVGAAKDGYSCHGAFGYDGERILEYAESHSLTIIDFVLANDRDRSSVTDAKVVLYETVAPQHRPLIWTFKIAPPRQSLDDAASRRQNSRQQEYQKAKKAAKKAVAVANATHYGDVYRKLESCDVDKENASEATTLAAILETAALTLSLVKVSSCFIASLVGSIITEMATKVSEALF
ncbi:unnamed protein product [Heligmosomoides polygyrus]|uniref:Endo/exonuclease/phosphatase domain-containing protein n=1 Tax=Heligmosomoides polygyrus TaxID=6339 RepID=A0A3P8AF63_HELPZ|nr:unnamed protein product [Heligmosomoides polygyrus]